jgi:hypothetical protein
MRANIPFGFGEIGRPASEMDKLGTVRHELFEEIEGGADVTELLPAEAHAAIQARGLAAGSYACKLNKMHSLIRVMSDTAPTPSTASTDTASKGNGQRKADALEKTVKAVLDGVRMYAAMTGADPEQAVAQFLSTRQAEQARLTSGIARLDSEIAQAEAVLSTAKQARRDAASKRDALYTIPASVTQAR